MTTMQSQDDLAALFYRNLSLQNPPPPQPELVVQPVAGEEPIVYSISQHYNHSAHLAAQNKVSRPASDSGITDHQTTEIILARHGVDVSTLFPSQIDLFKTADASQQMRLVELWRISPNTGTGNSAQDLGSYRPTSFQQEEALAKLRLENQMMEERASRSQADEDVMSDGELSNAPLTPIQGGDGRWNAPQQPEPYMLSGYEALAARDYQLSSQQPSKDIYSHFGTAVGGPSYNKSTDPVYQQYPNVNHEWAHHTQQQQQEMENQVRMIIPRCLATIH
jgi:hypothetical protein